MHKIFLFLAALAGLSNASAQVSWKDSVRTKDPVLDAYYLQQLIYFKTKKGWGAYDLETKRVILAPAYQFVLAQPEMQWQFFHVVKKNKIQMVNQAGKPVNNKTWYRTGSIYKYAGNDLYTVENDKCNFYRNDTLTDSFSYINLNGYTEFSLAVNGDLVILNYANQYFPTPVLTRDGLDSVNAQGEMVFYNTVPENYSGVYNLKTGEWIVQPKFFKTGIINNTLLIRKQVSATNGVEEQLELTDRQGTPKGKFLLNDAFIKPKVIKQILSDLTPAFVEPTLDTTNMLNWFVVEVNGKQGLYNPFEFRMEMAPEYQFVFMPKSLSDYTFTIKNNMVGLKTNFPEYSFEHGYKELRCEEKFENLLEKKLNIISCNSLSHEYWDDKIVSYDQPNEYYRFAKNNASVKEKDGFVIVNDFIAPDRERVPIVIVDQYGEMRDSISGYDELGYPVPAYYPLYQGGSFGGVFDLNARKWIVPRKFTHIVDVPDGFACTRWYNDTATFAFYTKAGKEIFSKKTIKEIIENPAWFSMLSGEKFGNVKLTHDKNAHVFNEGIPISAIETNRCGVFDLLHLKWLIRPENNYVSYSAINHSYLVFAGNKVGVKSVYGEEVIPAIHYKLEWNEYENGFIADDSLFYKQNQKVASVDTVKFTPVNEYLYNPEYPQVVFSVEVWKDHWVIQEAERRWSGEYIPDTDNMWEYATTFFSRVTDRKTLEPKTFPDAWYMLPFQGGYLVRDYNGIWRFENGNKRIDFSSYSNLGLHGNEILFSSMQNAYHYDFNYGVIDWEESSFNPDFYYGNPSVGENNLYFFGKDTFSWPKNFYPVAVNKSGFAFGYTITKEENKFVRTYAYCMAESGNITGSELPLSSKGILSVVPVGDYFVFMEENKETNLYTVWFMEKDLKTIKSTFGPLRGVKCHEIVDPVRRVVLYELRSEAKDMYFDKDFQFIAEVKHEKAEVTYVNWKTIQLKMPLKTLKINSKGRIVTKK